MHSEPSQPSTAAAAYYARFSDGKSASSRDVSVQLGITGVEISVVAPDEMVIWPYESLKAGEPVRTHAIDVLLPDPRAERRSAPLQREPGGGRG